jgi:UDPglucose 6-dehydrogenase
MSNIGFVGLGKLGLPVSLALESKGHMIYAYDISPKIRKILKSKKYPYQEKYVDSLLIKTKIKLTTLDLVVKNCSTIFIAVQTPHHKKYEGITRVPDSRKDFDYKYLLNAIKKISYLSLKNKKKIYVSIISTVLPLTFKEKIYPILKKNKYVSFGYNPFFIAMGTVIDDFLNPEFILFGSNDEECKEVFKKLYKSVNSAHFFPTTVENAEIIKVLYNTFISMKISFINNAMELCDKIQNSNIDDVSNALKMGHRRIISSSYLSGGMGDGGSCHPRDNIALSYLSNKLNLSYNFFDALMKQREKSTDWLAKMIESLSGDKHILICGYAFKANTNMIDGSPTILLCNLLKEKRKKYYLWDPFIEQVSLKHFLMKNNLIKKKILVFIGINHSSFINYKFDDNFTVIDPWRIIGKLNAKNLISIGFPNSNS